MVICSDPRVQDDEAWITGMSSWCVSDMPQVDIGVAESSVRTLSPHKDPVTSTIENAIGFVEISVRLPSRPTCAWLSVARWHHAGRGVGRGPSSRAGVLSTNTWGLH